MKVSLDWLREYVPVDLELEDLLDTFTMLGLEIESAVDRFDYLQDILVGQISEIELHPNTSALVRCLVNYGKGSVYVVSGAKNIVVGSMVPVALCGAVMFNGSVIRERKIKGFHSSGMLCSEQDLGVGIDNEGVMLLDNAVEVGFSMKEVLSLSDFVLDVALTPNRPDCLGMIGIARELAAAQGTNFTYPFLNLEKTYNKIEDFLSVSVVSSEKCLQYTARIIDSVEVAPSPFWLQNRLISAGFKPVNNVVDISNFVMLETGQPLHVFDFDLLKKPSIVIDSANGGEAFKTLDGKDLVLSKGMLLVSDEEKPLALAGVIGSLKSGVNEKTTRIVIESAYFDPASIRRTSKALGITTESSHRFERGVDPNGIVKALDRFTELVVELLYGRVIGNHVDVNFGSEDKFIVKNVFIDLSVTMTNNILGTTLSSKLISELLISIGFLVEVMENNFLRVQVPSFRVDVLNSEDLVEEVARLYGYQNIPMTFPKVSVISSTPDKFEKREVEIKSVLNALGFSEVINYSFFDVNSCDRLNLPEDDFRRYQVNIINPISSTHAAMRTSLLPNLLDTVSRNISKQVKNLMLFEVGKVFFSNEKEENLPNEIEMLTALWTGVRVESSWSSKEKYCDFFDMKGVSEEFFNFFGLKNHQFTRLSDSLCCYMRKAYTAKIVNAGNCLGLVGEVDSETLTNYSIKQKVFIFEINLARFYESLPNFNFMNPIPRFPAILRDVTVIVDEKIESGHIFNKIKDLNKTLIDDLYLLDVFNGSPIKVGMKSISFRVVYRSHNMTLGDEIVNRVHTKLAKSLVKEFNAILPPSPS